MLNNLKIAAKFNLLLILVFIISIVMSGVTLSNLLQQRAQEEVTSKALLLTETMTSIRNYTFNQVTPQFLPRLNTEPGFISEAIPAFSAKEVFELLRKKEDYKNFFYKPAALNPTNLEDKADQFEAQLIEQFRHDSNTKEISGFRNFHEGQMCWKILREAKPHRNFSALLHCATNSYYTTKLSSMPFYT